MMLEYSIPVGPLANQPPRSWISNSDLTHLLEMSGVTRFHN